MPNIELTLVIGQYAMQGHLPDRSTGNLTQTVLAWRDYWPKVLPLPHPSPRNNPWLKANPWFDLDLVPAMRKRIRTLISA
jgi:uracil-DNA glycosylase